MIKKEICLIMAALLLVSMGGCGKTGTAVQEAEPEEYYEERPTESMEQHEEPVYVYKDEAEETDPNMIFVGYAAEVTEENTSKADSASGEKLSAEVEQEADSGEIKAQYQDVSQLDNAIAIPAVYGAVGETVTANLQVCGKVDVCAVDLLIRYDKRYLEWVGSAEEDDDTVVNCDEDNGVVYINFLRIKNVEDVLSLCKLSFKILTSDVTKATLDITVKEAVSVETGSKITFPPFSVVDGTVYLNQMGG